MTAIRQSSRFEIHSLAPRARSNQCVGSVTETRVMSKVSSCRVIVQVLYGTFIKHVSSNGSKQMVSWLCCIGVHRKQLLKKLFFKSVTLGLTLL
jgi:hypothetical protein